jgi:rod shape determining protein RodA
MIGLILCGLLNLYSSVDVEEAIVSSQFFRQSIFFGCGFVFLVLGLFFDYRILKKIAIPFFAFSLVTLLAVKFVGISAGGATRWLPLGGFRFQPSEMIKVSLVVFLSYWFTRKEYKGGLGFFSIIVPLLILLVPCKLILSQPDMGTALHVFLTALPMFIFVKLRLALKITAASLVVGFGLWILCFGGLDWLLAHKIVKPYHLDRYHSFMNPEKSSTGKSYQIIQAKSAIGSGQVFGRGFRAGSQQQYGFLPAADTDFAFAALAEEWGFVGASVVLFLFFCLLWSAVAVIKRSRDNFGSFLALGLTSMVFWQMSINLAMVTGLMPVVGIPLPFVSYGGTSLLTTIIAVSIITNISMRRYLFQDEQVKQNPKVWQEGVPANKAPVTIPIRRLSPPDPNEPDIHPIHRLPHYKPWLKYLNRRQWSQEL